MSAAPVHVYALVICLGLVAACPAALSQESRSQVQAELGRTDRHIERAEVVVSAADNDAARLELGRAVQVQGNAKRALGGGRGRIALELTYRARARADRALALVRGLPDPDRVLAQLESTRELLDRARARVDECGDDQARATLRMAAEMQRRADDTGRAGRYLAALQLTMGARQRAHAALRRCRLEENVLEETERAVLRTDEVLRLAREKVSREATGPAQALLSRAAETQNLARRELAAGRYPACTRLTLSARALARRAARLARR